MAETLSPPAQTTEKGAKVKFILNRLGTEVVPQTLEWLLREKISEIKLADFECYARGILPPYQDRNGLSRFGNLSFRISPRQLPFIITCSRIMPSRRYLGDNNFARVIGMDLEKNPFNVDAYVAESREPSSETLVHYMLYQLKSGINAIIHWHFKDEEAHLLEFMQNQGRLPVTEGKAEAQNSTRALAEEVRQIAHRGNTLIMRNHGVISMGTTIEEAKESALNTYSSYHQYYRNYLSQKRAQAERERR